MSMLNFFTTIERFRQRQPVTVPARMEEASMSAQMAAMRRDLAVHASELMGAQRYMGQFAGLDRRKLTRSERRDFRNRVETVRLPCMIIDPRPGLHIIDMNDAYAAATLADRGRAAGDRLFSVFPDNPEEGEADGVSNLFESIRRAAQSGRSDVMSVQRYDVRDSRGSFVERHWQPVNTPVFDDAGKLIYVLHEAIEAIASAPDDEDGVVWL